MHNSAREETTPHSLLTLPKPLTVSALFRGFLLQAGCKFCPNFHDPLNFTTMHSLYNRVAGQSVERSPSSATASILFR